jgi:hypothetical protein
MLKVFPGVNFELSQGNVLDLKLIGDLSFDIILPLHGLVLQEEYFEFEASHLIFKLLLILIETHP